MRYCLVLAALLAVTAVPVEAHSVDVDVRVQRDRVELEAYFDDDTPARQARVRLVDATDQLMVAGQADGQGKCSFPLPAPGRYEIQVDAGAGHRRRTSLLIPAPGAAPPSEALNAYPELHGQPPSDPNWAPKDARQQEPVSFAAPSAPAVVPDQVIVALKPGAEPIRFVSATGMHTLADLQATTRYQVIQRPRAGFERHVDHAHDGNGVV